MPRAPKRCSFSCSNQVTRGGKCDEHQPVKTPWEGSNRDSAFRKSAEWERQRRRIIFREKGICQYCGAERSNNVDHIIPVWFTKKEQVSDDELQLLCKSCHDKKSSFEGVQAKKIKKAGYTNGS